MLMCHLNQISALDLALPPEQIFRTTLSWLVNNATEWRENGIFMKPERNYSETVAEEDDLKVDLVMNADQKKV